MIPIAYKTNLDLREVWPTSLPQVPNVGDYIESELVWRNGFKLRLQVVSVTWVKSFGEWKPEIELHIPKHRNMSITSFYEWYAPLIGKSVSAFI